MAKISVTMDLEQFWAMGSGELETTFANLEELIGMGATAGQVMNGVEFDIYDDDCCFDDLDD